MKSMKLFSFVLAVIMLFVTSGAMAASTLIPGTEPVVRTQAMNYSGKTVILHSNDVHGALEGYAYMTALKASLEAQGAEVIMVDAGDFSQGTTYVSTNKGQAAVELMNAAGYDVVTLGNHEFDFGYAQLTENLAGANFEVVCADIYLKETGELAFPASTIIEKGGVKIGFFGMETPETATKVNPGTITEISFATFDDLYAAAASAVAGLSEADIVIGLWHLGMDEESAANGYRSIDVLEKVDGVDLVIDGHSHTLMTQGPNGEAIQSTGTAFAYVGVVVIDNESKEIVDNYLISTAELSKDAAVSETAKTIIDEVDELYGSVFANTKITLNGERDPGNRTEQTNLGQLITDAMVWSVVKEGGIEQDEPVEVVGITNGGGIRATIEAGDITMKDINTVLPFGNTVAVIYVTGDELLEALEASTYCTPSAIGGFPQTSGIDWTLDTTVEYDQGDLYLNEDGTETSYYGPASIQRVSIDSVNGKPFDPAATYAVVTNNFCAAGGDTYNVFMRAYNAGTGFDTGIPMDAAVVNYITEELEGTITARAYGQPRDNVTQIRAEETEEEDAAA